MEEEEECVDIIIKLLEEVLNPNTKINELQVASLVKHLTALSGNVVSCKTLNTIIVSWLSEAISRWESNLNLNPAVVTLALNFSVYVASDEKLFLELNKHDIFQRFIKLIKIALAAMDGTPDVGYVKLMSAFLKHKSGCNWMINSNYWSEIIIRTLSSTLNSDFARLGYTFVAKLIANSALFNAKFCSKVINLIIAPIIDIAIFPNKIFDSSIIKNRESSFNLVTAVFENLLQERKIIIHEVVLKVINASKLQTHLDNLSQNISDASTNYPVVLLLDLFSIYQVALGHDKCTQPYVDYEYLLKFISNMCDFFPRFIHAGNVELLIKLCIEEHRICEKLGPLLPKVKFKDVITSFPDQLIMFELYACCYVSIQLLGVDYYGDAGDDDIREHTITVNVRRSLPDTIRFIYALRDVFKIKFTLDYAVTALNCFLEAKNQITTKESRTISLQYLITCLEDVSIAVRYRSEKLIKLAGKDIYILTLMKVITELLKEFNVNWQDIFETMLILEITTTIMQFQTWEKDVSLTVKYVESFNHHFQETFYVLRKNFYSERR